MNPRFLYTNALATLTLLLACVPLGAQQNRLHPDHLLQLKALTWTSISPDSREILFVQYEPEASGYYKTGIWKITHQNERPAFLAPGTFPRWSPDGKTIAFISNMSGSYQLWSMLPDGSGQQQLTSLTWGVHDFRWSPDGKTIALIATAPGKGQRPARNRNFSSYRQLFLHDIASGKTEQMTSHDVTITGLDWAPDSRRLVIATRPNENDHTAGNTDISIFSCTSKKLKKLIERPGADYRPSWSPDGRYIAFVTSHGETAAYANRSIAVVSPHGGQVRTFAGFPDAGGVFEGPWNLVWDFEGKTVFFTMTRGTSVALHALNIDDGQVRRLGQDGAVMAGLSFDRTKTEMAFLLSYPTRPWEVFRSPVAAFAPVQITHVNTFLDTLALGTMRQIHWKNTHGDTIEGLLVLPPDFSNDRTWPLLTYLHGGPGYNVVSSFRSVSPSAFWAVDRYLPWIYAARGYVVFMPNFHSSGGYGENFKRKARGRLASMPMDDVLAGVDILVKKGLADKRKLGLAGFGAGGYLAAYIIAKSDRFQAAIIDTAPVDPVTWWASAPLQIASFMGGDPWKARKKYRRNSPIEIADKIRTPTLFIHNETDPYISFASVKLLQQAVAGNGIATRLLTFREPGFSFIKPEHILQAIQENLRWLQIYVMSAGAK